MNKSSKIIVAILGTIGLTVLAYKLFGATKQRTFTSGGIIPKQNVTYNGNAIVRNADDIGHTEFVSYRGILDQQNDRVVMELYFNTILSPQIKPNADTFMNRNNHGLSEEIHEHENIHIELWVEIFQNMTTVFRNRQYNGSIDSILTQMINNNLDILQTQQSFDQYKAKEQELIDSGTPNLLLKYANVAGVENEVIRRLVQRHPEKTAFYNNGTIETIYQK